MTCHLNLLLAVPLFSYLTMNNQKWVVGNEVVSLPFSIGTRGENRSCKYFLGKSLHATQSCLSEMFSFQHQPRETFVYMAQCSLREAWGQVPCRGLEKGPGRGSKGMREVYGRSLFQFPPSSASSGLRVRGLANPCPASTRGLLGARVSFSVVGTVFSV